MVIGQAGLKITLISGIVYHILVKQQQLQNQWHSFVNRKFVEIFITFLQPGMKELKDSKDLISSCCYHHFHHLSAKSKREKKSFTLFQAIMNICQNMCDDFFFANTQPHCWSILRQKLPFTKQQFVTEKQRGFIFWQR